MFYGVSRFGLTAGLFLVTHSGYWARDIAILAISNESIESNTSLHILQTLRTTIFRVGSNNECSFPI